MKPTFNLITEPWIPVLDMSGRYQEVGLRHALAQAQEFQAVAAPTALETAAILRLLLAVAHRTHDTSSRKAWGEIWQRGCFDAAVLEDYWSRWLHRFDLFDSERPFYQQASDRKKPTSIAGFYPGIAASDHFNHAFQSGEQALSPGEAARNLLVAQTFGLSGGCLPSEKLSHKASSWVAGIIFFVEGNNLFKTLACNMLRYDDVSPTSELFKTGEDRPNWEADSPYALRSQPLGYLDYLTWPARRIWLSPESSDGQVFVRQYIDFIGLAPPEVLDPFKFYRKEEKSKNATGYIPLYLSTSKATWRNSGAILRLHKVNMRSPESLNWLESLKREGAFESPSTRLVGYGMVVENQTKVVLMRRESIPLPMGYLDQSDDPETREDLVAKLSNAIRQAELVSNALGSAVARLAELIYPRPAGKENDRLSPDQRKQVDRIVSSLSTKSEYWAELEQPFYQIMLDLAAVDDPTLIQKRWLDTILAAGRKALRESESRAGHYPKALRAGVKARGLFEGLLRKYGLTGTAVQGEIHEESTL